MSIFSNSTSYNPLYLEDATGLDADFDEAVLMDDTEEFLAKKRRQRKGDWLDDVQGIEENPLDWGI